MPVELAFTWTFVCERRRHEPPIGSADLQPKGGGVVITIAYFFITLALMLVVGAGVYGGVTAHKAVNGASGPELAVAAVRVAGLIAVAGMVALMTSYTAAFLVQFG